MASGLGGGSLLLSSWPRGSGEGPSFSLPAPGLQMSWAVSASAVRWPLLLGLPSNAVGPPLTRTQGPAHRLLSPRDSAEHPYLLTFFPVISPTEVNITLFPHEVLLTGPRAWGHFSSTSGCFFHGIRHAVGSLSGSAPHSLCGLLSPVTAGPSGPALTLPWGSLRGA